MSAHQRNLTTLLLLELTKPLMHRSFFPDQSICLSNYNKWLPAAHLTNLVIILAKEVLLKLAKIGTLLNKTKFA